MNFDMPCRDINALKPKAKEACCLFIQECIKADLSIAICQTLRTAEYQNSLYQQGRTKKGSIVTYCDGYKNKSNHQSGMAFDYFQNIKGHEWDKSFYDKAGLIGKKLGLDMGHYWTTFKDSPHCDVPENWTNPLKITHINKEVEEMVDEGYFNIDGKIYKLKRIFKDDTNYIRVSDLKQAGFTINYDEYSKMPVIISP